MESLCITLRLPPRAVEALEALTRATGGMLPRHRLAVEALTRGALALAANPSALFTPEARELPELHPAPRAAPERPEARPHTGPRAPAGEVEVEALAAALRNPRVSIRALAARSGLARSRLAALAALARSGKPLGRLEARTVRLVGEALVSLAPTGDSQ